MTLKNRYIRVTNPPPPPPVKTICERIATNQRGSLVFVTMNEIPAVKDVDVWEGADSLATGIHQEYMYEAKAELTFPLVLGSDEGGDIRANATGTQNFVAASTDLLLAFVSSVGSNVMSYIWDLQGNFIFGDAQIDVIEVGSDFMRLFTIDVPSPPSGGGSNFFQFGFNNSLGMATALWIRNGLRDVYASGLVSGSSPTLSITPTQDQSIVVACLVYQGTTVPNLTMLNSEGWSTVRTVDLQNTAGDLFGTMVLATKQVGPAVSISATGDFNGTHDGSSLTSIILASISPSGGPAAIWQQYILMKDIGGGNNGVFIAGEVLSLQ